MTHFDADSSDDRTSPRPPNIARDAEPLNQGRRHSLESLAFRAAVPIVERFRSQGSPKFGEVGEVEAPSDAQRWSRCTLPFAEIEREHTLRNRECQQIPLLVVTSFRIS
jgi:hypothetical protein